MMNGDASGRGVVAMAQGPNTHAPAHQPSKNLSAPPPQQQLPLPPHPTTKPHQQLSHVVGGGRRTLPAQPAPASAAAQQHASVDAREHLQPYTVGCTAAAPANAAELAQPKNSNDELSPAAGGGASSEAVAAPGLRLSDGSIDSAAFAAPRQQWPHMGDDAQRASGLAVHRASNSSTGSDFLRTSRYPGHGLQHVDESVDLERRVFHDEIQAIRTRLDFLSCEIATERRERLKLTEEVEYLRGENDRLQEELSQLQTAANLNDTSLQAYALSPFTAERKKRQDSRVAVRPRSQSADWAGARSPLSVRCEDMAPIEEFAKHQGAASGNATPDSKAAASPAQPVRQGSRSRFEITMFKHDGKLGMALGGGDGKLPIHVMDIIQIIEVDGQSLVGADNQEAVRILHRSDNRVNITLLRDPAFAKQIQAHLSALQSSTSSNSNIVVAAGALGTPSAFDGSSDFEHSPALFCEDHTPQQGSKGGPSASAAAAVRQPAGAGLLAAQVPPSPLGPSSPFVSPQRLSGELRNAGYVYQDNVAGAARAAVHQGEGEKAAVMDDDDIMDAAEDEAHLSRVRGAGRRPSASPRARPRQLRDPAPAIDDLVPDVDSDSEGDEGLIGHLSGRASQSAEADRHFSKILEGYAQACPFHEIDTIEIEKVNGSLGMSIYGGTSVHNRQGIFVAGINKGGAAARHGVLEINDQILRVDDTDLLHASKKDAVSALTSTGQCVRIVYARKTSTPLTHL